MAMWNFTVPYKVKILYKVMPQRELVSVIRNRFIVPMISDHAKAGQMWLKGRVPFRYDWSGLPCLVQNSYPCRITVNFDTMIDDSLLINTLASNNCLCMLCHSNVFQNGVNPSQKWLTIFCQKAQNFVYFLKYDFVQISSACVPNTYQIMYGETIAFQCQHQ